MYKTNTHRKTNMTPKNNHLKMYLLLNMVIFQPAMLVFGGCTSIMTSPTISQQAQILQLFDGLVQKVQRIQQYLHQFFITHWSQPSQPHLVSYFSQCLFLMFDPTIFFTPKTCLIRGFIRNIILPRIQLGFDF